MPALCNLLHPDAASARAAARGDVALAGCPSCGLVANTRFDPDLVRYAPGYDNDLHHSRVFDGWARETAAALVRRHRIRGGDVVEVGPGRGEFLGELCRVSGSRGTGYEPSAPGVVDVAPGVRLVPEPFQDAGSLDGDLLVCRHVLEHLTDPADLVRPLVDGARARDGVVYLEVPDLDHLLDAPSPFDVVYEHPLHFGAAALAGLVRRCGGQVLDLGTTFEGQYLYAEAVPAPRPAPAPALPPEEAADLRRRCAAFAGRRRAVVTRLRGLLQGALERRELVLWGAGSKGVSILAEVLADVPPEAVTVVDVNPAKQGRHVPVTGQRVRAPGELRPGERRTVLLPNGVYRREVAAELARLGVPAELLVLDDLVR